MLNNKQKMIAIVGPTASGKTALAIKVARLLQTEIISEDAFQIYRTLDIGTAKPNQQELAAVKEHFINIKDPSDSYNAYEFMNDARKLIDHFVNRNKLPVVVGGSGFFLQTLLGDRQLSNQNTAPVPQEASPKNRLYQALLVGLEMDRSLLYDRINRRVDLMFQQGLLAEAATLFQLEGDFQSKKAIGYREFSAYFDGRQSLDRTKELIKRDSRRYAKRQLTYFRNQFPDIHWFNAIEISKNPEKIFDLVKKFDQL